jgi:hypothetical protein
MSGRAPRLPTWRYGKRLLWRGYDEWGIVEVVEGFLGRGLHFGTSALQGRINREKPWLPVAEYAATMAAAAAFPAPQKRRSDHKAELPKQPQVCILGLGTGALAWTYHYLMPHAQITAIELRPAVVEVARSLFNLDKLSDLKLMVGDALACIKKLPTNSQTIIAIDLFTSIGMADCLLDRVFWREVGRVIHPTGVVCINTWASRPELFLQVHDCVEERICPAGNLYAIDHRHFSNLILFATPRLVDIEDICRRGQFIDDRLALPQFRSKNRRRRWLRESEYAGLSGESISDRLGRLASPLIDV